MLLYWLGGSSKRLAGLLIAPAILLFVLCLGYLLIERYVLQGLPQTEKFIGNEKLHFQEFISYVLDYFFWQSDDLNTDDIFSTGATNYLVSLGLFFLNLTNLMCLLLSVAFCRVYGWRQDEKNVWGMHYGKWIVAIVVLFVLARLIPLLPVWFEADFASAVNARKQLFNEYRDKQPISLFCQWVLGLGWVYYWFQMVWTELCKNRTTWLVIVFFTLSSLVGFYTAYSIWETHPANPVWLAVSLGWNYWAGVIGYVLLVTMLYVIRRLSQTVFPVLLCSSILVAFSFVQ